MDNLENERRGTANAAEAEGEKVAADLGKFKDVKALLDAYNSLEAVSALKSWSRTRRIRPRKRQAVRPRPIRRIPPRSTRRRQAMRM